MDLERSWTEDEERDTTVLGRQTALEAFEAETVMLHTVVLKSISESKKLR